MLEHLVDDGTAIDDPEEPQRETPAGIQRLAGQRE
jgi:hypothetical protein